MGLDFLHDVDVSWLLWDDNWYWFDLGRQCVKLSMVCVLRSACVVIYG